eukprot:9482188-Pyramimonas_sp.AAC.1
MADPEEVAKRSDASGQTAFGFFGYSCCLVPGWAQGSVEQLGHSNFNPDCMFFEDCADVTHNTSTNHIPFGINNPNHLHSLNGAQLKGQGFLRYPSRLRNERIHTAKLPDLKLHAH